MCSILDTKEDLTWLNDVHTAQLGIDATKYVIAIVRGNEDSPDAIELYAQDKLSCLPLRIKYNELWNVLHIVEWGNLPN